MVSRNVVTPPPPSINNDNSIFKGAVLQYLSGDKLHVVVTCNGQFETTLQSTDGTQHTVSRLGAVTVLYDCAINQVFNEYVEGLRREGLTLLGCYGKVFKGKRRASNG